MVTPDDPALAPGPPSPEVVVLGGLNLDLVVQVPALPRPAETVAGGGLALHAGGKGGNQAVAAARLEVRTAMLGRVGTDDFGRRLRASLEAAGVDSAAVWDDPDAPSGVALIAVDASGQNSIVVAPGANDRVSTDDVAAAASLFADALVLLLTLEVPFAPLVVAAERARAIGGRVILNAAPASALPVELIEQLDLLVVNEVEAAALLGLARLEDEAAAARALLGQVGRPVILTVGERGLWLARAGQVEHVPAFSVDAVDTTAAGDAFLGGLAAGLVRELDLPAACRYGAAAGALAVTRPGAQPSLPTRAEVERLMTAR